MTLEHLKAASLACLAAGITLLAAASVVLWLVGHGIDDCDFGGWDE